MTGRVVCQRTGRFSKSGDYAESEEERYAKSYDLVCVYTTSCCAMERSDTAVLQEVRRLLWQVDPK
jgi:hypothetical protein